MIIRNHHDLILSQSSNTHYWEQDVYPDWTPFRVIRHFPEQRIGTGVEPHYHDIANVALFLASDLSAYMTGTYVVVDGGLTSVIEVP